jgi:hypothetical protein
MASQQGFVSNPSRDEEPEIDEARLRAEIAKDPDLQDLQRSGLDLRTLKEVVDARITARNVIEHLEPHHVSGYADLIAKIEAQLEKVRMRARIARWHL